MNGANGVVEGWTIEARHTEIAEDEVIPMLTDQGYRLDPISSGVDHPVRLAQDGGQDFSEVLVVIDNQDALHRPYTQTAIRLPLRTLRGYDDPGVLGC